MKVDKIDAPRYRVELFDNEASYLSKCLRERIKSIDRDMTGDATEYTFLRTLLDSLNQ
jgi:translation initiation factor 2 alpha subunit (eIF-2alpha)